MSDTKLRKLVYIAGPIRKGDIVNNVANAFDAFHALKDAGFAPVCPHLSCFLGDGRTFKLNHNQWPAVAEVPGVTIDEWMEIDLSIVAKCDAVFRLPGESVGADKEVEFAKANRIPVYFSTDVSLFAQVKQFGPFLEAYKACGLGVQTRETILSQARQAVTGDRDVHYGSPEDNFGRIADLWNAYFRSVGMLDPGCPGLYPHEVASLLALVKIARSINSPEKLDNWIDLAGYAACGGEVAAKGVGK